jgi:prevent-host-death family protein
MKSELSIAEAKARFSELVNRVAYGGERIVITKRGKPIVVLSPHSGEGIGSVKGWLDSGDPFFKDLSEFEKRRHRQTLRASKKSR